MAHDPFVPEDVFRAAGVEAAGLDALLERSDVVTLHLVVTPETRDLIGEEALRRMKPTAYLVNTSRGEVVDEDAVVRALREGWIAGRRWTFSAGSPPRWITR